jgi:hypothetical protein
VSLILGVIDCKYLVATYTYWQLLVFNFDLYLLTSNNYSKSLLTILSRLQFGSVSES